MAAHAAHLLAAGTRAPDFTLHSTPDQSLSLSELRGQPVILAFHPAAWSPVCGDQMALYNEVLRWSYCSPVGVNPGADGILDALEALPGEGGANADRGTGASASRTAAPPPSGGEVRAAGGAP